MEEIEKRVGINYFSEQLFKLYIYIYILWGQSLKLVS